MCVIIVARLGELQIAEGYFRRKVLVDIVFVCRNLYSVVLLRCTFFWLKMLYHFEGIAKQLL